MVVAQQHEAGDPGPRNGDAQARAGLVLAWHRIASLEPDTHRLCVGPDAFRAQLGFLRDHCTVMPLAELFAAATAGALPQRAVALTFDDGYLDALSTAAPLLDGLPATFFVNTERIDEAHEAWHDELERLFPDRERQLALHAELLPLGAAPRRERLDRMRSESGLSPEPREERRVLLAHEVRRLSLLPGCEIGSHTVHHLQMPAHGFDVQVEEVRRAKEQLESLLDREVPSFAYPFGAHGDESVEAVRRAGHRVAVTVDPGFVTGAVDALRLPRHEVHDLAGLVALLGR